MGHPISDSFSDSIDEFINKVLPSIQDSLSKKSKAIDTVWFYDEDGVPAAILVPKDEV
jgi:hypothetical protein